MSTALSESRLLAKTHNHGGGGSAAYSGGTLMCPMLSVLLATLKMGSCDVTSFSIVCTMRFQTSRPRPPPNFNVYIEATSHMCPVLRQTLKLRGGGGF